MDKTPHQDAASKLQSAGQSETVPPLPGTKGGGNPVPVSGPDLRRFIYYWKCDRPAAFHGTVQDAARSKTSAGIYKEVEGLLERHFGGVPADLRSGGGQGNHLIYRATINGLDCLIRIEDGPEHDDYMEVEAEVIGRVRQAGIPSWHVLGVDSSRSEVPFAWQVVERVSGADLNQLLSSGLLDLPLAAERLGACVARWQEIRLEGFGPFQPRLLREQGVLKGFHANYRDYFTMQLDRHIAFLVERAFLTAEQGAAITALISRFERLLDLPALDGCLVHKDLALWNVIGEAPAQINAVIDWDDTVSGDPTDDISLLACFHDGKIISRVLAGYASERDLPESWLERFWLHLLRNMLWKSVIRVGSGYFDIQNSQDFFLTQNNSSLREFTLSRIETAMQGLQHSNPVTVL